MFLSAAQLFFVAGSNSTFGCRQEQGVRQGMEGSFAPHMQRCPGPAVFGMAPQQADSGVGLCWYVVATIMMFFWY
jgi:hypothetical protein